MAQFFDEKKIHHSQVISQVKDKFIIAFESNDSHEIIRYLAGYGDKIFDVKPADVHEKLKAIWKAGLKMAA
jgi:predicted DNA-binding transcriptional regulator YafY